MPQRFPKRYLAIGFAVCIGLMGLLELFHPPAQADALDRLFDGHPPVQLSAGVMLAE